MDKLKSACGYIRVSTHHQEELSPETQRQLVMNYARTNGYTISNDDIFEDLGISGKTAEKRPEFNRMIATCKSKDHPYDAVIVWKFSRFARNQEESVIYKRMLKKIGIDVISISEPISDDIGGRIAESIFEIMDEYYSINLSQEVMRGMMENAKRGNYQCRTPYAYVRKDKNVYEIVPEQAHIVRYIYRRFLECHGVSTVTRELNSLGFKTAQGKPWERRTVAYILENPFYCGKIRWNYKDHRTTAMPKKDESEWIIVQGHHEAIISEEDFKEVKKIFDSRRNPRKLERCSDKHWLSGLIRCAHCNNTLIYNTVKKGYDRYVCNGHNKGFCSFSQTTRVINMEKYFFECLEHIIDGGDYIVTPRNPTEQEIDFSDIYQKELAAIERKEYRIKEAYRNGVDTLEEYKENKTILQKEKEKLLEKLSLLHKEGKTQEQFLDELKNLYDVLKSGDFSNIEKNERLKEVVEKIIYDKDDGTFQIHLYG